MNSIILPVHVCHLFLLPPSIAMEVDSRTHFKTHACVECIVSYFSVLFFLPGVNRRESNNRKQGKGRIGGRGEQRRNGRKVDVWQC